MKIPVRLQRGFVHFHPFGFQLLLLLLDLASFCSLTFARFRTSCQSAFFPVVLHR